jgi:hypothetical protein
VGGATALTPSMKQLIALAAVLAISTTSFADKKPYTLADLKMLISQKSYKEAVEHLTDVAPSDRNADWLAVAVDAATGYIGSLNNDDLASQILEIERIDRDVPAILKSPKYSKVRADVGVKGFEACFGHRYLWKECFDHGKKFVDGDPTNADLALRMAKLVRRNVTPHAGAAGYFQKALVAAGKGNNNGVCKDPDLKLVVVSGFNVPTSYEDAITVRKIVTDHCWGEFKNTVQDEYRKASDSSYEKQNTCEILRAAKVMSGDQKATCEKIKSS